MTVATESLYLVKTSCSEFTAFTHAVFKRHHHQVKTPLLNHSIRKKQTKTLLLKKKKYYFNTKIALFVKAQLCLCSMI